MITEKDLTKLQNLSKLSFSSDELKNFSEKLQNVVEMIDSLKEVNCQEIQPLRSVCDMNQRTHDDKITISDISDQLFANIPQKNSAISKEVKCFVVPKMVE